MKIKEITLSKNYNISANYQKIGVDVALKATVDDNETFDEAYSQLKEEHNKKLAEEVKELTSELKNLAKKG